MIAFKPNRVKKVHFASRCIVQSICNVSDMDIFDVIRPVVKVSQFFGLASYELKIVNNVKMLKVSKRQLCYCYKAFTAYILMQSLGTWFTLYLLRIFGRDLPNKFVIWVHLAVINLNIFIGPLMSLLKKKRLCVKLNEMSLIFLQLDSANKLNWKKKKHLDKIRTGFIVSFTALLTIVSIESERRLTGGNWVNSSMRYFFFMPCMMMTSWMFHQMVDYFNIVRLLYISMNRNIEELKGNCRPKKIEELMRIEQKLKDCLEAFIDTYMLTVLLSVCQTFISTLRSSIFLFVNHENSVSVSFSLWILYYSYQMLSMLWTATSIDRQV